MRKCILLKWLARGKEPQALSCFRGPYPGHVSVRFGDQRAHSDWYSMQFACFSPSHGQSPYGALRVFALLLSFVQNPTDSAGLPSGHGLGSWLVSSPAFVLPAGPTWSFLAELEGPNRSVGGRGRGGFVSKRHAANLMTFEQANQWDGIRC